MRKGMGVAQGAWCRALAQGRAWRRAGGVRRRCGARGWRRAGGVMAGEAARCKGALRRGGGDWGGARRSM